MIKLLIGTILLISSFAYSQNLNLKETVAYINKTLPLTEQVNGLILESKINCDNYGNITFTWKFQPKGTTEIITGNEHFSLKNDSKEIWIHKVYAGDEFSHYQIRFESSKLSKPIHTIACKSKSSSEKLLNAFLHLKKIAKKDPFEN